MTTIDMLLFHLKNYGILQQKVTNLIYNRFIKVGKYL